MPNPFFNGNPVPSAQFINRRRELNRITSRITHHGQSTAIVGEPRSGKTSLLDYLAAPETRTKLYSTHDEWLLFTYLNAQTFGGQFSQAQFWEYTLRPLQEEVIDPSPDTPLAQAYQTCQENDFGAFVLERLLSQMKQAGWRLVLMLDEFDALLYHPVLNSAEFFGGLRSLASRSQGALALIIASRQSLTGLNKATQQLSRTGSPYFNFLDEITLGPWPNKAVDELLGWSQYRPDTESLSRMRAQVTQVKASLWLSKQPGDQVLCVCHAPMQVNRRHTPDSRWHQARGEGATRADGQHTRERANRCSSSEPAQGHHDLIIKQPGQVIAQGNKPMLADLPVVMQLFPNRSQERIATRSSQLLRVDHQTDNSRLVSRALERGVGKRRCFTEIHTLLLEPQFQQGGDQQGVEVNRGTSLGMAEQVQTIHRAFQESEDQLHLPPVSIQQDDLESGQIQTIGQNQVPLLTHPERDQTIDRAVFSVGQTHSPVGDVAKQVLHRVRQIDWQPFHPDVHQIGLGSEDKESLGSRNRRQQRKAVVPPVSYVGHTRFQHLKQGFLLVRLSRVHQKMYRNHAVQLKTEMQTNRLVLARVFGPQHRRYCGKDRPIHAVQLAQRLQFGNGFPDHDPQQKRQHVGKPRHRKALKRIEERRTLHFAQSQLRCCGRNIGQQLTPRLTALGEVVDQQPHERFEVQRLPMVGGMVTFVPCQEWLEWLEQYVKRGTIFFGVTWFSHYAAPLAGLQHVLPDDSFIVKLLYGCRLSGQYWAGPGKVIGM